VISHTTKAFRKSFAGLPQKIQKNALKAYRIWWQNPHHSSLQFKQVHATLPIFSVRVGLGWRAVGIRKADTMIWYWIGSHDEYDALLKKL
jgi:hypothetical protein